MKIKLLKPYSVWTAKFKRDCIAEFYFIEGMWREDRNCFVGIGASDMNHLLAIGYAIKTTL